MKKTRPNSLNGAPLQYAPQNELGVVFLFAHVARRKQFRIEEIRRVSWGLSKRATIGDLLLIYRCRPNMAIRDVYTVTGEKSRGKAGWRDGDCYSAMIERLGTLDAPVFLQDFRSHRVLKTAWFVRANFQGNLLVSEYWPYIYEMIVARNPGMRKVFRAFDPQKM